MGGRPDGFVSHVTLRFGAEMALLENATRPARLYPAPERDDRQRHFATLR